MPRPILVTGARGHIGSEVLAALRAAGHSVRASSRHPMPGEFPDGVEVARADLTDPSTFPALLDGVAKVFLYANAAAPDAFAAEARKAGVDQIVLLSSNSVLFPEAEKHPIPLMHMQVERALEASGIDWTFVRPGYLATNVLGWTTIRTERILRTAFPEGGTPLVHERDVAAVAVEALLNDDLRRQAYLVLGGRSLTVREQVSAIADAIGEPVRLEQISIEAYRAELRSQIPEIYIEPLIAAKGEVPQVPMEVRVDCVPDLLGRPPLSFAEWARDHAEDFR